MKFSNRALDVYFFGQMTKRGNSHISASTFSIQVSEPSQLDAQFTCRDHLPLYDVVL